MGNLRKTNTGARERMKQMLPSIPSALFAAMEIATAAALFVFGVYLGVGLVTSADVEDSQAASILKLLHANWKVGALFVIPLFYRAIKTFLDEVTEIGSVKLGSRTSVGGDVVPSKTVDGNPIKPTSVMED